MTPTDVAAGAAAGRGRRGQRRCEAPELGRDHALSRADRTWSRAAARSRVASRKPMLAGDVREGVAEQREVLGGRGQALVDLRVEQRRGVGRARARVLARIPWPSSPAGPTGRKPSGTDAVALGRDEARDAGDASVATSARVTSRGARATRARAGRRRARSRSRRSTGRPCPCPGGRRPGRSRPGRRSRRAARPGRRSSSSSDRRESAGTSEDHQQPHGHDARTTRDGGGQPGEEAVRARPPVGPRWRGQNR